MLDLDPRNREAVAACAGDQGTDAQDDPPEPPLTMLFVDDDHHLCDRIGDALLAPGLHMLLADGHAAACVLAAARSVHRARVAPRGPSFHRLAALRQLAVLHPELEIVVLGGTGSIATAVETMRLGPRPLHALPGHAHQILVALETYPPPA